jgi:hypothetical protein
MEYRPMGEAIELLIVLVGFVIVTPLVLAALSGSIYLFFYFLCGIV